MCTVYCCDAVPSQHAAASTGNAAPPGSHDGSWSSASSLSHLSQAAAAVSAGGLADTTGGTAQLAAAAADGANVMQHLHSAVAAEDQGDKTASSWAEQGPAGTSQSTSYADGGAEQAVLEAIMVSPTADDPSAAAEVAASLPQVPLQLIGSVNAADNISSIPSPGDTSSSGGDSGPSSPRSSSSSSSQAHENAAGRQLHQQLWLFKVTAFSMCMQDYLFLYQGKTVTHWFASTCSSMSRLSYELYLR